MDSWYVYITKAKTGRFYTGISVNPQERLKKHNSGAGAKFAINQGPLELVYISSSFLTKSEARKREMQIKKWSRIKKSNLINGVWV